MRKKIVAGNWKMNLSMEEAADLVGKLKEKMDHHQEHLTKGKTMPLVLLFPPSIYVTRIVDALELREGIEVGAQNCHQESHGAYTGELAASMIQSAGATHVLVGHSERRQYFGENDALLALKVKQAITHGLIPVFCCGENLSEREEERHYNVVEAQMKEGLFWLEKEVFERIVIAYEPVWAIGTGKTASPDQAQEMHARIRQLIGQKYGEAIAEKTSILYGGSCNAKNAGELMAQPDVDGGLIGGASLKPDDFFHIIMAATA